MNVEFQEAVWVNVAMKDSSLIVGVCYRSPASTSSNDEKLLRQFELAVQQTRAQHVMILGDFNYPEIDCNTDTVLAGEMASSTRFFYTTHELCLFQYVRETTRERHVQLSSLLDYIFMDEDN